MDLSRPKVPVTITFSVPGTKPPVYVASSLTHPAWTPVEMNLKDERTASGDLIFEKKFGAVELGEYQYKFRLGPGDWWVCDESAPIVCDDAGNRNNLVHVKPPQAPTFANDEPLTLHRSSSAPDVSAEELMVVNGKANDDEGSRSLHDSAPDSLPLTVAEEDPAAEQAVYGDAEPASLEDNASERSAHAEPDAEFESAEATSEQDTQSPAPVPVLVVEKTDNVPAHGEDMGANATQGQQDAHEKRAADANPDKVIVSGDVQEPKPHVAPFDQENTFLLPHENFDVEDVADEAPLLPHERSGAPSSEEGESDADAVASAGFEPVEFDGDTPLFRHESIALSAPDSPPRSPSAMRSKSHTSLKDMMDEEDVNDPSLQPFPTRRETIYEHIHALEQRMDEDVYEDDGSETPPTQQSDPESPTAEQIPPPSPLGSIQEDDNEEESDEAPLPVIPTSHEVVSDQSIPGVPVATVPIAAVPTPPLTPKEDDNAARLDRADSVVTVVSEDQSKDSKNLRHSDGASDGTQDAPEPADPAVSEPQPTDPEPTAAASAEVDRPGTSHSTKITPERKHSSFLINFWNSLFGGWLGPVVRWFSRICGGKGRATVIALAITTAVVAYSYQTSSGAQATPVANS